MELIIKIYPKCVHLYVDRPFCNESFTRKSTFDICLKYNNHRYGPGFFETYSNIMQCNTHFYYFCFNSVINIVSYIMDFLTNYIETPHEAMFKDIKLYLEFYLTLMFIENESFKPYHYYFPYTFVISDLDILTLDYNVC